MSARIDQAIGCHVFDQSWFRTIKGYTVRPV